MTANRRPYALQAFLPYQLQAPNPQLANSLFVRTAGILNHRL
jgi:hypothetical protein